MKSEEKQISYTTTNTYSTLNDRSSQTKNTWFVCHGMGYLSRYFLKYFAHLDPTDNYIIAPQAQSKYYIPPAFKHVGASWLTKENTKAETDNVMRNFDAIFESEGLPNATKLIIVGYSQGVSVAMRYVAKRQLKCSQLVLMSGGIPKELQASDFKFLDGKTKVTMIYGKEDEYLSTERIEEETERLINLFGKEVTIIPFDGKHVVNTDLIQQLL